MISSLLLLISLGVASLNGAAGMMTGGSSGSAKKEQGVRDIYVEFHDNLYVHSVLTPMEDEPAWVTYPHLRTLNFDKYLIYAVIYAVRKRVHAFKGEALAPIHGEVQDYMEHIPKRIALTALVPGDLDNFVTDEIEPYRQYEQLEKLKLPPSSNDGHFGYVFIAIKNTKRVYVAKLYLQPKLHSKSPGQEGSSSSGPYSPTHHIFN